MRNGVSDHDGGSDQGQEIKEQAEATCQSEARVGKCEKLEIGYLVVNISILRSLYTLDKLVRGRYVSRACELEWDVGVGCVSGYIQYI